MIIKKIKYIIGTFVAISSIGIVSPILVSCKINTVNSYQSEQDNYKKIEEAKMHLISEQSAIDLSMIMYESIISRDAIPLIYEDIAEKIVLDKNNFIYQKIKENNLESKLNNQVKYAIYESYLEELNNTENIITNRCGNFLLNIFEWLHG